MIAGATDEIVKPGAFASENDDEIAGEIELIVSGGAAFVETDDPEIVALELFKGANEIDDAGDAEVLGSARTGFDGSGAKWSGAALGEEDAIDTGAIGDAKKSSEVLRIFNAVEREDEAGGGVACGRWRREEVLEGEKFLRVNERDDTLVVRSFSGDGKLLARPLKDANASVAALGDEAAETFIVALAGDENVIEPAATGLESFRDRMQPVENFHRNQFSCRTRYEDSLALASRLRLTPCSAACTASDRCTSGGMRTRNWPL
jgi:hypothetical protein